MAPDRWWSIVRLRVRSLFRASTVEHDLADELRDHIERETAAGIARGLSRDAARTAAYRRIGGVESVKEQCRDQRGIRAIDTLHRDVRYGARLLWRSPGFTIAAVVSLTLGIGANTAIFQLINAVRLRPIPVAQPNQLAIVDIADREWPPGNYDGRYPDLTAPLWTQLQEHAEPFTGLVAWGQTTFDLSPRGQQRFAENSMWVSGGFFDVLGVRPAAGRLFTAGDDVRGCGAPGVVVSHAFWRREFVASPAAVGSTITINSHPFEIIGVTEAGFFGVEVGRSFDLAVPICAEAILRGVDNSALDNRRVWWLSVMGRLKPGWSVERATTYLKSISRPIFAATPPPRYGAEDSATYANFTFEARPGEGGFSGLREQYDTPLWLLLAVAGVVLLIACVNIANLLLARAGARTREMAVRLALGASRRRLVRQLFVESLLLATIGAVCGAWLAPVLGGAVVQLISTDVSPLFVDFALDWRLLAFTIALAATTCVLFGLAPALRATGVPPIEAMSAGGRSQTSDRGQSRLRRGLVAVQVALSFVLLVAGLLFGRSLMNLLTLDAGFQQAGILELDMDLSPLGMPADGRRATVRDLRGRLRALPIVDAATTTAKIPMGGGSYSHVFFDRPSGLRNETSLFNVVGDGYFQTLRIPLLAGRDFNDDDRPEGPGVVIVNEAFATEFMKLATPAQAVGMTFQLEGARMQPGDTVLVAGVVGNTKYRDLRETFRPIAYLAASQGKSPGTYHQFLVRSRASFPELMTAVRAAVGSVNPDISFHFHDFQGEIRNSLRKDRLLATLCGFFAFVGALLAAVGVYGVNAYSVTQRTAEIGIRIALGADRRAIVSMILREAGAIVAIGLMAGVALARVGSRVATDLLFGLRPMDPVTIVSAVALLGAAALCASYVPARRASRANPVEALRRA